MGSKELPISAETIEKLPSTVRLICEAGTGYNNIDVATATKRGIYVCNCPAYSTDATAQLAVTFIMNFSCSLVKQQRMLASGVRDNFTKALQVPHFELSGKTLGIVGGNGSTGTRVAEIAITLGMRVLVSSRSSVAHNPAAKYATLEEVARESDFISIHVPMGEQTRGMFDLELFKKMKPEAYLINVSRGPIVKQDDLVTALQEGMIAGAAIDVQEVEPPPEDSPLYTLENLIMTPHIGWKRKETRQRLLDMVAANVQQYLWGNPINVVSAGVRVSRL